MNVGDHRDDDRRPTTATARSCGLRKSVPSGSKER
jgi:hypothetical protein